MDVDKRVGSGQGGGRGPAPEAGHHQRHQDHRRGWQGQEQTQLETARRRENLDYHVNVMLWILLVLRPGLSQSYSLLSVGPLSRLWR